MSGYGDAALKVQVSSPLQAMVDWQKLQEGIATTGQTQAQTGLLGQQTVGAGLDNQTKALTLGIRSQLLGATGPGGGQAPAGMPGAGQGGAPSYAPGFGDAGPTAVSTPFGVPIPRTAYLSAMMSNDPMKSVVETYNMGRQVISQTLTQAGDPTTDPAAAMRVQQAAQTLYANGWIGTDGYLQLMKDPAKAKVFVDATMSPDTHVSRANSLSGMGARLDENGQVVIDPGAIGAHATKSGAEAEAQVAPAVRKAGGIVGAETPGLVERKRQELEAGARYKTLEPIKVPDLDERGVQKVDKNGQPMFVERYVQPGVTGGSTAVPGQTPARGVNTRGPTLQGPGASDGGNPLLGGLEGDPTSLASEGLPAGANVGGTSPNGFQPPAPPPLPPLPAAAGSAAPATPAAPVVPPAAAPAAAAPGAAAPTPAPLGGNPALTDQQKANVELERNVEQTRQETDIKARAAEVEGVAKTYGEVAGSIVKAGTDTSTKMQRLDVLQNAMEDFRPGVSAETRAAASKRLVDAIQFMGGTPPDWMLKGATGAEVIGKEGGYLAAEMTRMLGAREAASVFNQIKSIQPGLELSTGGFQAIVNSIRQGVQRDHDLFTFQEQWLKSHNSIAGMVNDFNTNHPVEAYASRVIPYPAPQKPSDLKPNVVYRSPNGALGLWDGAQFLPAPTH